MCMFVCVRVYVFVFSLSHFCENSKRKVQQKKEEALMTLLIRKVFIKFDKPHDTFIHLSYNIS